MNDLSWPICYTCNTFIDGATMLAIRLNSKMENELSKLAAATGRSKSYYVREALAAYLQDHADYLLALAALERQEPRTSLSDVRKELGLER